MPRPTLVLWLFAAGAPALVAAGLIADRADQTQARCNSTFDWASNSVGSTPCLLAADVWGSCFGADWDVPAIVPGMGYAVPNATTANLCTCSWAAYNLLSACTACQGFDSSVENWAAYNKNCGGFLTDTWFPANVTLPQNTAIPAWAGTNPQTWQDGRFNSGQAEGIANENLPPLTQGSGSTKHKKPIGAIVGGVVGGIAVLVLGGLAAFYYRRRTAQASANGSAHSMYTRPTIHGRSMSDISDKHAPVSLGDHRPGTIYTTGTLHTRTGSAHSLSQYAATVYTTGAGGRAPTSPLPSPSLNPEDIIDPFPAHVAVGMSGAPSAAGSAVAVQQGRPVITRKGSEQTMRTVMTNTTQTHYNHSTEAGPSNGGGGVLMYAMPDRALGAMPTAYESTFSGSSERTRLNPPAYTETPLGSPSVSPEPVRPPRHEKASPSVDTVVSYESTITSGHGHASGHVHSPSAETIDEVVGRMPFAPPPESVVATTIATDQSGNLAPVRSYRPTVSNPDEHDEA